MKYPEVETLLKKANIPYRVQEHEAVYTVSESSRVLPEKTPVKSLLLTEYRGARVFMIAMRGDVRLDLKKLAEQLAVKRLKFVNAEHVEQYVGVKPGSVSIFGLLNDTDGKVEALVDEELLTADEVGFHPNVNTATIYVAPKYLEKIINKMNHEVMYCEVA